jgi:LPXTG-site transpeptidase (sortase) family protein
MENHSGVNASFPDRKKRNVLVKKVVLVLLLFVFGGVILPAFIINGALALQPGVVNSPAALDGPDLTVEKAGSGDFSIGDNGGEYTITVKNVGGSVITGPVSASDALPNGLNIRNIKTGNPWDCSASTESKLSCTLDNENGLDPGEAALPIRFSVDVAEQAAPRVNNTAAVSNTNDLDPGNNTASLETTVTSSDLQVEQSVSTTNPAPGEVVSYTVTVRNNGPSRASQVVIDAPLPQELVYVDHSSELGQYSSEDGVWKIASLENQSSAALVIRARVTPKQAGARILGSAGGISADQHDWDLSNDKSNLELQAVDVADLDVDMDHNSDSTNIYEGQNITFITRITNEGNDRAQPVVITDELGTDFDYISSSITGNTSSSTLPDGYTRVWEVPRINPGQTFTLNLTAKVKSNLVNPLSLMNIVTATTSTDETNLDDNVDEVIFTSPVIDIAYTVNPSEVRLNQSMNFLIEVENSGTGRADNMRVETQTFPSELTISNLSANISGVNITTSGGKVVATVGTLSAKQLLIINFRGTLSTVPSTTRNEQNLTTVSWQVEGVQNSKISSSVSYRLISTTLPPTGGMERERTSPGLALAVVFFALFLGAVGFAALLFGLFSRGRNPAWAPWYSGIGLLLIGSCMVFGLGALTLGVDFSGLRIPSIPGSEDNNNSLVQFQEPWLPKSTPQVPETLPDFPVPTPEISQLPPPEPDEPPPDTSPPFRLHIPALEIDAVVKYVPFEDYTWLIAGLRQEIAWMGETSWPGLGSNTGLAGHVTLRDGSDGPFRDLHTLENGDEVKLETDENIYTYKVREQAVVDDEDMSPIQKTDNAQLSLVTCTGWDPNLKTYTQRTLIFADLVEVEPQRRQISSLNGE